MDDAVYTFEQILHQSLESQTTEELCKTIQRCQDRVIKVKHTSNHTFNSMKPSWVNNPQVALKKVSHTEFKGELRSI